jgi:glycosyltransferase involved in cell wall biosynthesis
MFIQRMEESQPETSRYDQTMNFNDKPNLSVIIPAYNEGRTINELLEAGLDLARAHKWEIIVVDDGSEDDTAEKVRQCADGKYLRLVSHKHNRGYGASLKSGIRASTAPRIATIDSDGQHDPNDLLRLLPYLDEYELVIGARSNLIHSPLSRMPGKWVLKWLANYLTGRKIPDLNSGLRLFHADVIRKYIHLCPDGFSFSTTTTLIFLNRGYNVAFESITIHPRKNGGQSTVNLSTGFATIILILRMMSLFQPLRIYIPASLLLSALGVIWGFPYIILQRGISVGALLLIITGILLFFFGLLTDQVAESRLEKYE